MLSKEEAISFEGRTAAYGDQPYELLRERPGPRKAYRLSPCHASWGPGPTERGGRGPRSDVSCGLGVTPKDGGDRPKFRLLTFSDGREGGEERLETESYRTS